MVVNKQVKNSQKIQNAVSKARKKVEKLKENKYFLNEESSKIIEKLTSQPFAIGDEGWLYWLFCIQLVSGGWEVDFWLENTNYRFSGWGTPDEAVKMAYEKIDKKWLENGMKDGKDFM